MCVPSSHRDYFVTTITKDFTVKNIKGWHARPCALIARTISQYPGISVTFYCPDRNASASGTSLFEMMVLAVNCGDRVTATLTGKDTKKMNELLSVLEKIMERQFFDGDF